MEKCDTICCSWEFKDVLSIVQPSSWSNGQKKYSAAQKEKTTTTQTPRKKTTFSISLISLAALTGEMCKKCMPCRRTKSKQSYNWFTDFAEDLIFLPTLLNRKIQCCGSWMFIQDPESEFFPSRIQGKKGTGSRNRVRSKEFKYFLSSNCYKALGNMIRNVYPGSQIRTFFYLGSLEWISDPEVKKALDSGSQIRVRNAGKM